MRILILGYCFVLTVLSTQLKPQKSKEESIAAGEEIYQDFCVQCHLNSGEGVSGVFPPLKSSDYLLNNIEKSIAGIKYGLKGKIIVNGEIYLGQGGNQFQKSDQYELFEKGEKIIDSYTNEVIGNVETSLGLLGIDAPERM